MLRVLVLLLVVANLLLLGWQKGWLGSAVGTPDQADREPERMKRQVNVEQVRVLSAVAASAALAEAARQAAESASAGAASAAASTPVAQGGRPGGPVCLEAGPLAAAELPAAERALKEAGLAAGSWSTIAFQRKGNFMLYMGKYADDEALAKKIEELKRLKVEASPIANWPDLQPGLVLGKFDDRGAADATLGRLAQRGVRTARVIVVTPPVTLNTLRVAAATPEQRGKLGALKLPPHDIGFAACPPPPVKP